MASSSNSKWFTILLMSGAVTTGSTGTSSLFNNKSISSIGGKKYGKRKVTKKTINNKNKK